MNSESDGRIIISAYISVFLLGIAFWAAVIIGIYWFATWATLPPILR